MGYFLLIIAVFLAIVLIPLGWLYTVVTFRSKPERLNSYAKTIALSIDQLGNVVLSTLFNDIMITKEGYQFGNEDQTISAVLGVNKRKGTLLVMGKALSWILNVIDKDHVEKASKDIEI